jgi:heme/copper-type cytochrome/quinol oxidase subunit 4
VATFEHTADSEQKSLGKIVTWVLRFGLAILIPLIAFFILYQGFAFLRAGNAPKWVIAWWPSSGV